MLSLYPSLARISFSDSMAFRLRTLIGILNLFIVMAVNVSIWRALYAGQASVDGIGFATTATNLIIGIGISSAFRLDEFAIARRIRSGDIAVDLLRPANFVLSQLATSLGQTAYRIVVEFIPALLVSALVFGLMPPASFAGALLFVLGLALGYLVFFLMNLALSFVSFWYFNIWSFVTIRNTLVTLLAGVYIPYWFMPGWLRTIVSFTPFDSIYSVPLQCWLGLVTGANFLPLAFRQLAWILGLGALDWLLWKAGRDKLAVQGG